MEKPGSGGSEKKVNSKVGRASTVLLLWHLD